MPVTNFSNGHPTSYMVCLQLLSGRAGERTCRAGEQPVVRAPLLAAPAELADFSVRTDCRQNP